MLVFEVQGLVKPYVPFEFIVDRSHSSVFNEVSNITFENYNSSFITNKKLLHKILQRLRLALSVKFQKHFVNLNRTELRYEKMDDVLLKCNQTIYVDFNNGPLDEKFAYLITQNKNKNTIPYMGKEELFKADVGFQLMNMYWDKEILKTRMLVVHQSGLLSFWTRIAAEYKIGKIFRGTPFTRAASDEPTVYTALGLESQVVSIFLVYLGCISICCSSFLREVTQFEKIFNFIAEICNIAKHAFWYCKSVLCKCTCT